MVWCGNNNKMSEREEIAKSAKGSNRENSRLTTNHVLILKWNIKNNEHNNVWRRRRRRKTFKTKILSTTVAGTIVHTRRHQQQSCHGRHLFYVMKCWTVLKQNAHTPLTYIYSNLYSTVFVNNQILGKYVETLFEKKWSEARLACRTYCWLS